MLESLEFNPWNVTGLDDFLFYCCPECDKRTVTKSDFIEHALNNHPRFQTFIDSNKSELKSNDLVKKIFLKSHVALKNAVLSLPKLSEATIEKYTKTSENLRSSSDECMPEEDGKNGNVVTLCYTNDDSSDSALCLGTRQ